MIVIRHVSGPLAGQAQTFGEDQERIVIGRDPDLCQVVYPPDHTAVGRRHVALVRELSGDYAVDLFGDYYVEINGVAAESGQSLPRVATIRLGHDRGPVFRVEVTPQQAADGFGATEPQKPAPPVRLISARARRSGIAAAVIAVLVAAGLGGVALMQQREQAAREAFATSMANSVEALAARQRADAAARISPADRERLARAAFAVIVRSASGTERLQGTAWPVAPRVLATNAHVAALLGRLKPDERLLVRPPGTTDDGFPVDGAVLHPGYAALQQFLNSDPLYVTAVTGAPQLDVVPGYDVALLRVQRDLPSDLVLRVATREALLRLAPGEPLALAGYPYEQVRGSSLQAIGRTPQVQTGHITALTDNLFLPAEPEHRSLIHHSLPATGGASGSPVINATGAVVGLLSAGNIITTLQGRAPSAVQINYAQRADLLLDLLAGRAAERVTADRPYWERQAANFKRGVEVIIPALLARERPTGARERLDREISATLTDADRITAGLPGRIRLKSHPFTAKQGSEHFFVAYSVGGAPISAVTVMVDGKAAARETGKNQRWAAVRYNPPAGDAASAESPVTIVVEAADQPTSYVLRHYVWEKSGS